MNVNQADYLIPKEDYDELFSDYIELTLKNDKLQNNWNELKKCVIDLFNRSQDMVYLDVLNKMQELENGKNES